MTSLQVYLFITFVISSWLYYQSVKHEKSTEKVFEYFSVYYVLPLTGIALFHFHIDSAYTFSIFSLIQLSSFGKYYTEEHITHEDIFKNGKINFINAFTVVLLGLLHNGLSLAISVYFIFVFFTQPLFQLSEKKPNEKLELLAIDNSVNNIKQSIANIDKTITTEQNNIIKVTERITDNLRKEKFKLDELIGEQKSLLSQIEQYKKLEKVGEENINSILNQLDQNQKKRRYYDFFMGVIAAIITNFVLTFLIWPRLKKARQLLNPTPS